MKNISRFITERMNEKSFLSVANTYLENIGELDFQHQQHFLNRMKLCNGFEDLSEQLISELDLVHKMNENILKLFNTIQFGNIDEGFKTRILDLYESDADERKKKVYEYLLQNDTVQFKTVLLLGVLLEQYSVYLKMHPDVDGNEWAGIKKLIVHNWQIIEDFSKDSNNIINMPVNVINLIFYLRYICEISGMPEFLEPADTLIDNAKRILIPEFSKSKSINMAYGLTHIIIGESAFYTREITPDDDMLRICGLLAEYLSDGKEMTNDIMCEAALCLKLADEERYYKYITEVKENCLQKLSHSNPILYNFSPGLQNNEHTNILFILLELL